MILIQTYLFQVQHQQTSRQKSKLGINKQNTQCIKLYFSGIGCFKAHLVYRSWMTACCTRCICAQGTPEKTARKSTEATIVA